MAVHEERDPYNSSGFPGHRRPELTLTAGPRGLVLLLDVQLIEKLGHFDRERIPERVFHARGAGTPGYFQVHSSMAKYTRAYFLPNPGEKNPVLARFS